MLDDGRLLRKLADATRTLVVGPAADPATEVGPLIHPPAGPLARALTRLDRGESWLVEPPATAGRSCGRRGSAPACGRVRGSTAPSASGRCSA